MKILNINNHKPFIQYLKKFAPLCHRGARLEFPENTIPSFRRALEILPGAILELDVHETADHHVVVSHDNRLDIKSNGKGLITDSTLSALREIEAGYNITFDKGATFPFRGKGIRYALLEEVFEQFPSIPVSIDIKLDRTGLAERVVSILGSFNAAGRVVIGSFHDRIVKFIRAKYPEFATAFGRIDTIRFLSLQKMGLAGFSKPAGDVLMVPEFIRAGYADDEGGSRGGIRIITERFMRNAHSRGIPVVVWTVNDETAMRRIIGWGADGIVTDTPRVLKKVMAEYGLE